MKKIYTILLLVGWAMASCTTDIDLKLDGTSPMLVVDGVITTDTMAHSVYLQRTTDYFSNTAVPGVSGATVTLTDGLTTITLTESAQKKGLYLTPATYYGVAGRTYTLHISGVDVDGDGVTENYEAASQMQNVPTIDNVSLAETELFGNKMWALKASFQEPGNEQNNYLMRNYHNGKLVSDTITEWGVTADEFFNGVYLKNETMMYYSSTKKDENIAKGDTVMFELCGITKEYLNFIDQVVTEYRGHNPMFGGQPANILTNVKQLSPAVESSKGPRGYFAAYAVKRKSMVY